MRDGGRRGGAVYGGGGAGGMSEEERALCLCGVCGILVAADSIYRPFCSKRCQQIDLGRWASGDYSISGEPVSPWSDDEETEH